MQAAYPEDDTPEAREGTAAHHYPSELLQGRVVEEGSLAPNGEIITREMIEGAQELIADIITVQSQSSPDARLYVEHFITGHGMIHPLNEGTPDYVLIDYAKHSIFIWDYKFGHRFVDEYENWQILDYLAMVVEGLELDQSEFKGWRVRLSIAQPRYYRAASLRHWDTLGHKVWPYFAKLAAAAELAADPNSPTRTGPHCRNCRALGCEARQDAVDDAIEITRTASVHDFTPETAARQYRLMEIAAERLKGFMSGLEAYLVPTIKSGHPVPGYEVAQSMGNAKWTIPVTEVLTLGQMYGVDLAKPQDVITPTQAKAKGVDASVIQAYSARQPGEFKLQRVDTTRASRAFGS